MTTATTNFDQIFDLLIAKAKLYVAGQLTLEAARAALAEDLAGFHPTDKMNVSEFVRETLEEMDAETVLTTGTEIFTYTDVQAHADLLADLV